MLDRRALPRHLVDFKARLVLVDGSRVVDCCILDMTPDGARIAVGVEIPDRVYLWELQTNMVFECSVRWREGKEAGIYFIKDCSKVMRQAIVEACSRGLAPCAAFVSHQGRPRRHVRRDRQRSRQLRGA
jgi:hypothetical protein